MPAGTIALTNNSTAVTGTGTSFTSELKANDFVVVVVGGVTYTLGVKSVESATALTLITAYGGANGSGLSWTPVPNAALVGITAQVAADVAKAIRGLNLDKANWQQIFSGTGNVTVTLPDGSSWTGPAWNGIATSISGKMDKIQNLNDLQDKPTSRNNLGLGSVAIESTVPVNKGGTGATTAANARTALGVSYANLEANPGGGVYRLFANNDSKLMVVVRRFNITAAANSATGWSYNWTDDGAGTFTNYPGISINGQAGNSGNWRVGVEDHTPSRVTGFIHNTGGAVVVWITVLAIGVKA